MTKMYRASGHYADKPKTKAPAEKPQPRACCCDPGRMKQGFFSLGCPMHFPTIALLTPQRERKMEP